MEINASDFALGVVLSQLGNGEKLHPIAFHSQKFSAVEINYEIHDKELLAIVDSFREWHHLLEGALHQVIVYTDHKNLEYFMSTRILNRCQAHWNISLSRFDFGIVHRPRKKQGLLDCGSTNKQIRRRKALKQGKCVVVVNFFLAKQMHFCLASRVRKFRTNTRNGKVS